MSLRATSGNSRKSGSRYRSERGLVTVNRKSIITLEAMVILIGALIFLKLLWHYTIKFDRLIECTGLIKKILVEITAKSGHL